MFKALKEKLKSWFQFAKKTEEAEPEKEAKEEKLAKPIKKEEKASGKKKKIEAEKKEYAEPSIKSEEDKTTTIQEPEAKKPAGFFAKLKEKFSFKITPEYFNEIFENLELILLENNASVKAIDAIKAELEKTLLNKEIKKNELEKEIRQALKQAIENLFIQPFDLIKKIKQAEKPFIILFAGINGSGKTTTIAKIAYLLQKNKLSCVLAAADTFRAASIEQLSLHAEKLQVPIIKHEYGSDPASVGFDAVKYAQAHNIDVVLIDTAGRMHTKTNLIHEMEKIVRVTKPNLKIFIGEAITGNDATEQARIFNEAINIDAIILAKQDVDEKGGTAISVSKITGKPILYLGVGQKMDDLIPFDKEKLIEQLGL